MHCFLINTLRLVTHVKSQVIKLVDQNILQRGYCYQLNCDTDTILHVR